LNWIYKQIIILQYNKNIAHISNYINISRSVAISSAITWCDMLFFFYYKEYITLPRKFLKSVTGEQNSKRRPVTPSAFSIRAVHASRRHEDIRRCWFLPCLRQKEETCHVADAWFCIPGRTRFLCKNSERNGQAKITCQVTIFQ